MWHTCAFICIIFELLADRTRESFTPQSLEKSEVHKEASGGGGGGGRLELLQSDDANHCVHWKITIW